MTEAEATAAEEFALALNRAIPDHLAPDAVALSLLTYLTALAESATPQERHHITVLTCNAAGELAGVSLPRF